MRLDLSKDNAISLRGNNQGSRLRCDGGIVWVTQAGDSVDYFLVKGEEFTIRSSGTVIIEARRDATVTVEGCGNPALRRIATLPVSTAPPPRYSSNFA